jgi:chemotaxis protein MotA
MTLFFLLFGFAGLIGGYLLEGGHIGGLIGPSAFIIVVGGTIGATGVSTPFDVLKQFFRAAGIAIRNRNIDFQGLIQQLVELSTKARKEGMLALEGDIANEAYDPFLRNALGLAIDGMDPETVRDVMGEQIYQLSKRHETRIKMFESAGGFSPTMGILGTVMGLVHVLSNLSNPDTLGPAIAAGFLATMYGIGFANIIFLPIAARLKAIDGKEGIEKTMILEGVLSLVAGESPTILTQKLKVFLDKKQLEALEVKKEEQ